MKERKMDNSQNNYSSADNTGKLRKIRGHMNRSFEMLVWHKNWLFFIAGDLKFRCILFA